MNNINENFEVVRFLFISKDSIKFYYNNITNKYILLILSYNNINYPDGSYLKVLEFEYDDNETINITKITNTNNNPTLSSILKIDKYFNFYFDETIRKYYINSPEYMSLVKEIDSTKITNYTLQEILNKITTFWEKYGNT